MKQHILILSVFSLLLFGAWGCPENPDKPKQSTKETVGATESVEINATETAKTTQASIEDATELAKAKAKRVIEEMKATTPGSTEETK